MNTGSAEPGSSVIQELRRAVREVGAPSDFEPALERPRDREHGDFATNAAMVLAGILGARPRELAERIVEAFDTSAAGVERLEVAGPGFLNFRLSDAIFWRALVDVVEADHRWGRATAEAPARINVEFVSANPTGPLHVAHGRGAAIGDAVASLLEWTGHQVEREFYVNDAGRQIELLAESVDARFREASGEDVSPPEGGYMGDYVRELAKRAEREEGTDRLRAMAPAERVQVLGELAMTWLLAEQKQDLEDFGVRMDVFRSESELYTDRHVEGALANLAVRDLTYDQGGATWLRTTRLGDDKDRVLVKGDGTCTYFLPDIAYHLDKRARMFDVAIDVWGADHHGHIARMQAALEALGVSADFLEVVLIQLVTVLRDGKEVRMSKRAGDLVTLRDLFEETGVDVARYFFLMRRAEVPMNFDLDLALDTSEANPVYKIQYAHARMCSVFERAGVTKEEVQVSVADLEALERDSEKGLAKALLRFPEVVLAAAAARAPYQICTYLEKVAGDVNAWYHEGNLDPALRVIAEGPARPARLGLARAVQITLRNGLELLGISAPERLLRDDPTPQRA